MTNKEPPLSADDLLTPGMGFDGSDLARACRVSLQTFGAWAVGIEQRIAGLEHMLAGQIALDEAVANEMRADALELAEETDDLDDELDGVMVDELVSQAAGASLTESLPDENMGGELNLP